MFCHIFGEFLVNEKLLTENELSSILDHLQTIHVKLGYIAIAEKMLTEEQVSEINLLQSTMDRRFGDIAVKKGKLTEEQVQHLLMLQGNVFMQFSQAVRDLGLMSPDELQNALVRYGAMEGYEKEELEAIKSGDLDQIADVLLKIPDSNINEIARLTLRNINRFISDHFYFGKAYEVDQVDVSCMVYQGVKGTRSWMLGFAAEEEGLLSVANLYSRTMHEEWNEKAIHAVQGFIHCTNRLHATKVSTHKNEERIQKACYVEGARVEGTCFVVPIVLSGSPVQLIIRADEQFVKNEN